MTKTYTLGLYEKAMPSELNWEEKLKTAKETGYDFVEISIDETDEKLTRLDMSLEERMEMIRLMNTVGIPIRTMCLSAHRKYSLGNKNPDFRAKGLEILEKAVKLADDLGIRIIQLAGYDVYYEQSDEETKKYFIESLKKGVEIAAKSSILLGFETMETEFMNTVQKSMNYVNMICSAYLNVYPDLGNITSAAKIYHTDVLEDLKTGKGHLIALHLKETAPNIYRELTYGTGHVDFKSAIHTAWELGVRKYVTEFWYMGNSNWKNDLKLAYLMMSEILDAQTVTED